MLHYSAIFCNCKNWFNETGCGAVAIFNLIKQFFLHTADSVVHSFVFALQLIAMYNNKNAGIYHEALGSLIVLQVSQMVPDDERIR